VAEYPGRAAQAKVFVELRRAIDTAWGRGESLKLFAPEIAESWMARRTWGMFERAALSPAMARRLLDWVERVDVRAVLPTVAVRTLVLHRTGDHVPIEGARYMAEQIPGASFIELQGGAHAPITGDINSLVGHIEMFVVAQPTAHPPDHVLATILAVRLADPVAGPAWDDFPRAIESAGGSIIDATRSQITSRFDGPRRALQFAHAALHEVQAAGTVVSAAVHTGECAITDGIARGVAVEIASQIAAAAPAGELHASVTVRDLVFGSGIEFEPRSAIPIRGSQTGWEVHAVIAVPGSAPRAFAASEPVPLLDRAGLSIARHAPATSRAALHLVRRAKSVR
jgi:hypothetical protein